MSSHRKVHQRGVILIGSHFIKGWARAQNQVTLSSAEAELVAMVKCTAECMGIRSLLRDWGVESGGIIFADSSAALAIAKRKGAGKLRHIHVSSLWIQDVQDREETEFRKILGTENLADLMTKYLVRDKIDLCLRKINQERREGRASKGLELRGATSS